MSYQTSVDIGGRALIIETGRLAKQANGSAYVRYGDTVVLVSACSENEPRAELDYLPLTVDYREYQYAAGKIPGGFFKREGRPSEKEILTSRLIDRPIRPLFPSNYRNESQVIAMVLSADQDNDPDVISICGASAALYLSDIPFTTPIGAVRVGLVNGQLVANPTYAEQKQSLLNIVVVGVEEGIVMVEAGAQEVSEEAVVDAIQFGHENIKKIIAAIKQLASQTSAAKRTVEPEKFDEAYYKEIESAYGERLADALNTEKHKKKESYNRVEELAKELLNAIPEEQAEKRKEAARYFEMLRERIFRDDILHRHRRPDGRAFDQIRAISCDLNLLPRVHGSALFTRGETQALVNVTLGTKEDVQRLDLLHEEESFKRFMLHYNFPPFSVGEVKFLRGPGRREIGHGALAERALLYVLPPEEIFPYTVRIVSDILESNGSSSMATVCGGSLALMDAGVPVKAPVGGIAMGLVLEDGKYAVLTDIAGAEDHYGDMDFKVAGTAAGITALQMDIKIPRISPQILGEALQQAKKARLEILEKMNAAIAEPRTTISPYAPRIFMLTISTDKIRDLIGPGGKMIRSIVEQCGVKIDVMDDGKVHVFATDENSASKAIQMIQDVTATPEVGKTYLGKVVRLVDFGAFVEIFPGTDGLLHISEVAEHRIRDVRDELKEGDQVLVKVLSVDGNKIKLSRKAVLRDQRAKQREPEH